MKIVKGMLLVLAGVSALWLLLSRVAPPLLEKQFNYAYQAPPYAVSAEAAELHKKLLVGDMHADSLLWRRDLNQKSDIGLADVPRLLEGNVALQGFTIVTKSPKGQNENHNTDETDRITALTLVQAWPPRTWFSLAERALYQMEKLHRFADQSEGRLLIIKSRDDLKRFVSTASAGQSKQVAGWLGIEGAHALEGDINNLQRFYDAGLRTIGMAHFFDNAFSGSAHGDKQYGLTDLGKELVKQSQAKGVLIDLAHTSAAAINDVLAMTTAPVIVSHTGVRGTCNNNRNLSDAQLKAIAKAGADQGGSLIGIGYWDIAVCGRDVQAIVEAMDYTAELVGVEHVGLGSDYDGSVATPFDTSGLALITQGLMQKGYSESDIRKMMGENLVRVLAATLP